MRVFVILALGALAAATTGLLVACSEEMSGSALLILVRSELQPDPTVGVFVTAQTRGGSSLQLRGIGAEVYSTTKDAAGSDVCFDIVDKEALTITYAVAAPRPSGGALVGNLFTEGGCKGSLSATQVLSLTPHGQSTEETGPVDTRDGSPSAPIDAQNPKEASDTSTPDPDAGFGTEASTDATRNEGGQ